MYINFYTKTCSKHSFLLYQIESTSIIFYLTACVYMLYRVHILFDHQLVLLFLVFVYSAPVPEDFKSYKNGST